MVKSKRGISPHGETEAPPVKKINNTETVLEAKKYDAKKKRPWSRNKNKAKDGVQTQGKVNGDGKEKELSEHEEDMNGEGVKSEEVEDEVKKKRPRKRSKKNKTNEEAQTQVDVENSNGHDGKENAELSGQEEEDSAPQEVMDLEEADDTNVKEDGNGEKENEEIEDEELLKITEINIKQFRTSLKNPLNKVRALEEFISVCDNKAIKEDYAKLYLEKGGSCLELIEHLGTNVPEILVVKTLNIILLKIIMIMKQHKSNAYEACRSVLTTHLLMVNRMVNKGSGGKEQTAILKLLATMVLLSDTLAKEILIHVNFSLDNVNALSRQVVGGGNFAVRDAFTHFLIAFLINGSFPIISLFLNKTALLTSVIRGFKFDPADNVCMYFNIVKKNVLENTSIAKTVKMKVFNTTVIKDIVNLYNWIGPVSKKSATVSEVDKSKVSAEVHAFLLSLCASKYGIIFRDYTMGRGRRNVLMDQVITSLKQPWEHSYASDLVSNICGACPDLVPSVWTNLKGFLEPRNTQQWLNAVKFTMEILDKVQPECIEYCSKDLDLQQYTHMVKTLAAPSEIIKVLKHYPTHTERHTVFKILEKMLNSVLAYKTTARQLHDSKFNNKLDVIIRDHVETQFPPAIEIFNEWNAKSEHYKTSEHLQTVLNILELYNKISFNLLDSLLEYLNYNIKEVIGEIKSLDGENKQLEIRAILLFTNLDPGMLLANSYVFEMIIPEILENYHESGAEISRNSLRMVFANTGIFENCETEIETWINSIDNVKQLNESLVEFFIKLLRRANEKSSAYYEAINQLHVELGETVETNHDDVLESILDETNCAPSEVTVKQNVFSPMILAAFETLHEINTSEKSIKAYVSCVVLNLFHCQIKRDLFKLLIEKNEDIVDSRLTKYIYSWDEDEVQAVQKFKGRFSNYEVLSAAILTTNQEFDCADLKHTADYLQMVIFYLTNLRNVDENVYKTCLFYAKKLSPNNYTVIFRQGLLLKKFNPLTSKENYSNLFVIEMIKYLTEQNVELDSYISAYRFKLFNQVLKAVQKRKLKNMEKLAGVISMIKFDHAQCKEILCEITKLGDCFVEENKTTIIHQICHYTLETFINTTSKRNESDGFKSAVNNDPLPGETIGRLCDCLCGLNESATMIDSSVLARNLLEYLRKFPHAFADVSEDLFKSILTREENCKENAALAVAILKNRAGFVDILESNIEAACNKKGLILQILDLQIFKGDKKSEKVYGLLEASVCKVLQKPQKAGQNFEQFYTGLCVLVEECMAEKTGVSYVDKVHKFECSEIFHVELLSVVFKKFATTEKRVHNSMMTMMHVLINLFKRMLKNGNEALSAKITRIAAKFNELLKHYAENAAIKYADLSTNETYKLFCKFCLKFGVGDNNSVVELLVTILDLVGLEVDGETEFVEMMGSHSEFLNTILGTDEGKKVALLRLFLLICQKYGKVMCKAHIPILLGGYSATLAESDQLILQILKKYESIPQQTNFYDFKPILWGTAAINHYSVRSDVQRSLFRQPRVSDVLDIIREDLVLNTIDNHPLDITLTPTTIKTEHENVYDLRFLLPVFSQILAPENHVPAYMFTKSGALSVTILGLSHSDKEVRSATCHVLARFHQHLEARQVGKDNKLWIRFIEALCKGTAVLKHIQLNNFASVFFARMALTIIKPYEIMYKPLCHYLSAKSTPNLALIPELYTFLHSSDVNYKEHTVYILRVLRDGLRTTRDLKIFNMAMAHKLIMEIYTSTYSDFEIKRLILEVIKRGCELSKGAFFFCNIYGLLSWLQEIVHTGDDMRLLRTILETLLNVIASKPEDLSTVNLILRTFVLEKLGRIVNKDIVSTLLKCVLKASEVDASLVDLELLRVLVDYVRCEDCEYMLRFKQVLSVDDEENTHVYYVKHLTRIYLKGSM